LTSELDESLAVLDQLQRQLTGLQQQSLPTDVPQADDMTSKYEVLALMSDMCPVLHW